jgi:hypothetical protein
MASDALLNDLMLFRRIKQYAELNHAGFFIGCIQEVAE